MLMEALPGLFFSWQTDLLFISKIETIQRQKLYNHWISGFHLRDGSPVTCSAAKMSGFKKDFIFRTTEVILIKSTPEQKSKLISNLFSQCKMV